MNENTQASYECRKGREGREIRQLHRNNKLNWINWFANSALNGSSRSTITTKATKQQIRWKYPQLNNLMQQNITHRKRAIVAKRLLTETEIMEIRDETAESSGPNTLLERHNNYSNQLMGEREPGMENYQESNKRDIQYIKDPGMQERVSGVIQKIKVAFETGIMEFGNFDTGMRPPISRLCPAQKVNRIVAVINICI
uniref:Uncharacterized protein n=1 Tax=Glossina austeni TaxID=7395 RepID=A0A1A9V4K1_GLOAU